jgi:hypothetical protein
MANSFQKILGMGIILIVAGFGQVTIRAANQIDRPQTFCNPLDLAYRFQLQTPSRREAADPTLVQFKGEY